MWLTEKLCRMWYMGCLLAVLWISILLNMRSWIGKHKGAISQSSIDTCGHLLYLEACVGRIVSWAKSYEQRRANLMPPLRSSIFSRNTIQNRNTPPQQAYFTLPTLVLACHHLTVSSFGSPRSCWHWCTPFWGLSAQNLHFSKIVIICMPIQVGDALP